MKRLVCLILCLSLFVSMTACRANPSDDTRRFYYHRTETAFDGRYGVIAPEERELRDIPGDLDALLALYCAGPVTPGLENPLPPGSRVLSHTLTDETLTLHFAESLADLEGVDLTLAAGCLARTFLSLTGAKVLVLTAEGALMNGETAMRLTLADLEFRDSSLDRRYRDLTVYYTDQERRYLIPHEITLAPTAPEELPMQLLELLLTPPAGSGLRSALPEGTRFLSANLEDGLCTVDLNAEFEDHRFFSYPSQILSIMSMVNTLTGLPEIQRVEFTVAGRLLIRYGPLSLTGPMLRDERCLGPVRTGLGEQDVTLYLAHGEEGRLLGIPVRLGRSTTVSQAELIIRHLLDDPGTNGIGTRIPAGTMLNSVQVTGSVCVVDLSANYLNSPDSLAVSGRVIAASLCTLKGIKEVRILVNGAVPSEFDSAWFTPLRPNMDWYL